MFPFIIFFSLSKVLFVARFCKHGIG